MKSVEPICDSEEYMSHHSSLYENWINYIFGGHKEHFEWCLMCTEDAKHHLSKWQGMQSHYGKDIMLSFSNL